VKVFIYLVFVVNLISVIKVKSSFKKKQSFVVQFSYNYITILIRRSRPFSFSFSYFLLPFFTPFIFLGRKHRYTFRKYNLKQVIFLILFKKLPRVTVCIYCLKEFDITHVYHNSVFPFKLLMRMSDGNYQKFKYKQNI
jgi:hypothetical protein